MINLIELGFIVTEYTREPIKFPILRYFLRSKTQSRIHETPQVLSIITKFKYMMRGLFRYEAKDTIMHRLDPRVKLCWVFGMSVLSMLLGTPLLLAAAFASTIPFWMMVRPSAAKVRAILFVFGTMVFGFMLTQSFFYYWGDPENPTFTIIPAAFPVLGILTGGVHFYLEGAIYGLLQSLRFVITVSAASVFVASTHPSELLVGLVRFIKVPFTNSWIGVPNEIAFMCRRLLVLRRR